MNYWFLSHFPSSLSCVYCLFPFLFFFWDLWDLFFFKAIIKWIHPSSGRTHMSGWGPLVCPFPAWGSPRTMLRLPWFTFCSRSLWVGGGCCPHGQSAIRATGSAGHRLTEAWRSLSSSLYLGSEVTHTTVTWSRPTPESREVWPSLYHEGEEDWIGEVRDVYHSLSFSLLMIYGFNAVVGNYKVDIICTLKSW